MMSQNKVFNDFFFLFVIMYCQILAYMREFNKKLFIFKYFKNYANPKNIYPRRGGVLCVRGVQKPIFGNFTR